MLISGKEKIFFQKKGYLIVENILTEEEVSYYDKIYHSFLDNKIDALKYRSDLSGNEDKSSEKITQIMVPSKIFPELIQKPIHKIAQEIARELLGDDLALDFDMLINKAPNTHTITPWHQDAAYWIDMPDKRAVSCWVAIDRAYRENGCMWYTPGSHLNNILPHTQTGNAGALKCEGSESKSVYVELNPGSCVFHHGATLHYSRGNSTNDNRRAFITNFRPLDMINYERSRGFDHTGGRNVNS